MSQASKYVEWCLSKARKEIEECRKLGKREKHRGLLKKIKDRWQSMKPIQRKFWTWYIIIKIIVGVIILALFIVFIMVFKRNLWE